MRVRPFGKAALKRCVQKVVGVLLLAALGGASAGNSSAADESKPTPENTIVVHVAEPPKPQKFTPPPKFWIAEVIDRSGNPQPMLVLKSRGGIFLDKLPAVILKGAIEESLKPADLLAADANAADLILKVYVFHFGLAEGSGLDFFGKVEFTVMVKNPKTGETVEVKANGTSIAKGAMRKKSIQKNVQEDIEEALSDSIRSFVRGTQLKDAVAQLMKGADIAPAKVENAPAVDSPVEKPPAANPAGDKPPVRQI